MAERLDELDQGMTSGIPGRVPTAGDAAPSKCERVAALGALSELETPSLVRRYCEPRNEAQSGGDLNACWSSPPGSSFESVL